tara:strand:+ start:340 stop:519 length:180 start_codon:yes stop_codon:yes gene_type:complete
MSTTKHDKEKEEPKVAPEWFQADLGKMFKRKNFERLRGLMEQATVALKDYRDELEKAQK